VTHNVTLPHSTVGRASAKAYRARIRMGGGHCFPNSRRNPPVGKCLTTLGSDAIPALQPGPSSDTICPLHSSGDAEGRNGRRVRRAPTGTSLWTSRGDERLFSLQRLRDGLPSTGSMKVNALSVTGKFRAVLSQVGQISEAINATSSKTRHAGFARENVNVVRGRIEKTATKNGLGTGQGHSDRSKTTWDSLLPTRKMPTRKMLEPGTGRVSASSAGSTAIYALAQRRNAAGKRHCSRRETDGRGAQAQRTSKTPDRAERGAKEGG
jgi:hypothetical protein